MSNIDRVNTLVTMKKLRLLDHTYYLLMSTHLKESSSCKPKCDRFQPNPLGKNGC